MEFTLDNEHTLVQVEMIDASAIYTIIDQERSYLEKWLPFVTLTNELKDTEAYIHSLVNAPNFVFEYVFTIRSNNKIIGMIGFVKTDIHNKKTEIGYWMSEHYQGKGIMTKSVNALINFAFETLAMNRIQIKCAVGNTPSSNIPKRLGYTFEGIERDGELQADGSFKDLEIYSLLKSEI